MPSPKRARPEDHPDNGKVVYRLETVDDHGNGYIATVRINMEGFRRILTRAWFARDHKTTTQYGAFEVEMKMKRGPKMITNDVYAQRHGDDTPYRYRGGSGQDGRHDDGQEGQE